MSTLRSIVLCGGSGTRLWPLSRALYPKQFMDLGGHTLFGDTVDRAAALPDSADPLVVCNEEHRFYVAAALQQKGVSGTILLEPKGRNTAPAIALAAFAALSGGGDPLLLVLPSDHVLKPQDVFAEAVARARACAESGRIVTFGGCTGNRVRVYPPGWGVALGRVCCGALCGKTGSRQSRGHAGGRRVSVEQRHVPVPRIHLP